MRSSILFLALGALGFGAPPTVGTVTASLITDTSVNLTYTASPASYCWVEAGTDSGMYDRSSVSIPSVLDTCVVTLANLEPATTYFVRGSARPNLNNSTDIGYASEISFTTAAYIEPTLPTQPTPWDLQYPDVTGYVVVNLTPSGSGPDNCGLQAAIDAAAYGTIINVPQGATCYNVDNLFGSYIGFYLREKAVPMGYTMDDPDLPWIIIQTCPTVACVSTSPVLNTSIPLGVRVTAELAAEANLATFKHYARNASIQEGSIFQTYNAASLPPHHYWVGPLAIGYTNDVAADQQDVLPYSTPIYTPANPANWANRPDYIVFDRIYYTAPAAPFRASLYSIVALEGEHMALLNSSIGPVGYWIPHTSTLAAPQRSSNTITIASGGAWQQKVTDSSRTIPSAVTAVWSATGGYDGTFVAYLDSSNVTHFDYTTPGGGETGSFACTNCTATAVASPAIPAAAKGLTSGVITSDNIASMTNTGNGYGVPGSPTGTTEGAVGVISNNGPGPAFYRNNYIGTHLINFFVDNPTSAPAAPNDVVFEGNTLEVPQEFRYTSDTSDGFLYTMRNVWEIKRGRRWLITGNTFRGEFGERNNNCGSVLWSARPSSVTGIEAGVMDQTFINNTIEGGCAAFAIGGLTDSSGVSGAASLFPPLTRNIWIKNNFFNNINGLEYTTIGDIIFGNIGALVNSFLGFDNVYLANNTGRRFRGSFPTLAGFASAPSAKLTMVGNILSLSAGTTLAQSSFTANTTQLNATFPADPSVVSDASFATTLAGSNGLANVVRNVLIGGMKRSGAYPAVTDLDGSDMTTIASTWPDGNTFAAGNTEAARETAAGLMNNGQLKYSSPYLNYGFNLLDLTRAQGLLTNFRVRVTAGQIVVQFTGAGLGTHYTAQCSDDNGATWTDAISAGAGYQQASTFSLAAATVWSCRVLGPNVTTDLGKFRTP